MTEIATRPPTTTLVSAKDEAIQRLVDWAASAEAAHQIALRLVETSFVPDAFKNQPGEATAAILAGSEVGLSPLASLRSFDIIKGQAAPKALTLRAVALANGAEIELIESTATRCKMQARRSRNANWQIVLWTIERAKSLGLHLKGKDAAARAKNPWNTQPQAMLVARATSEAARLVAADAILGLGGYSVEEIRDEADVDVGTIPTSPRRGVDTVNARTRRRRMELVDLPPDDPPLDDETQQSETTTSDVEQEQTAEPEPERPDAWDDEITQPKLRNMGRLFSKLGMGAREQRGEALAYVESVIGRPIESRKELTIREADDVIDALMIKAGEKAPPSDEEPPPIEDYDPRDEE